MVSYLHVNLISCRVGFMLGCFNMSNSSYICAVARIVSRSVYLTFDLVHKYPREGSKILAFLLPTERNQLWSVYFDPLLLEA